MDSFNGNPLWSDIALPPSLPALADDEFIALLQKQFGANNGFPVGPGAGIDAAKTNVDAPATTNINPQSLTRLSTVRPAPVSPPSEDSSPSPPSTTEPPTSHSRRQSQAYGDDLGRNSDDEAGDDPTLKRKASEEFDDDDEPSHKSQHTSANKKGNPSRRKSTGNPNGDENRLLKRKEQNRAAQRAFRERKEKHVKDLEDKVSALEEKNATAVAENENLREVVSRLQTENIRLRQSSFTFNVPSPSLNQNAGPSTIPEQKQDRPIAMFNSPQTASTSSSVSTTDSPQSMFADKADDPLAFLNNPGLTVIGSDSQATATGDAMNLDFGFPPLNNTPYTTIASNPLFMSFREPDPLEGMNQTPQTNVLNPPFDINSSNSQNYFTGWPDVSMENLHGLQAFDLTNSLDELFGGSGFSSSNDFFNPTPSTLSPVSHRKSPAEASSSSSSSGASPAAAMQSTPNLGSSCFNDKGSNKCTKEALANSLAQDQGSMFAPRQSMFTSSPSGSSSAPETPALGNSTPGSKMEDCKEFPPCKGLQLPKTQRNEKNVEVMSAWKAIRHDPNFQDVDINQLCTEFAAKARCDGLQVVIEPSGMQEILDSVTQAKRAKQHEQLFSAGQNLTRSLGSVASK